MSVCFWQQNTTRLGQQGEGRLAMLTFRQLRYAFKCNFENIWIRELGWIAQDLYVGQIDERHDCRLSPGLQRGKDSPKSDSPIATSAGELVRESHDCSRMGTLGPFQLKIRRS